jgi:hypothetical protein
MTVRYKPAHGYYRFQAGLSLAGHKIAATDRAGAIPTVLRLA